MPATYPVAPDLVPPLISLGGDVGLLVVEPGGEGLGLARSELEPGQDPADLVGTTSVCPADEAVGLIECERPALPVGEQVEPAHPEAQLAQLRPESFLQ
jgi:hypothetical protein